MESADWLKIIGIAVGLLGLVTTLTVAVVGWHLGSMKAVKENIGAVAKDLANHRVEIARDYPTRNEFTTIKQEINGRLDRMERWMGRRFDKLMGLPVVDPEE